MHFYPVIIFEQKIVNIHSNKKVAKIELQFEI